MAGRSVKIEGKLDNPYRGLLMQGGFIFGTNPKQVSGYEKNKLVATGPPSMVPSPTLPEMSAQWKSDLLTNVVPFWQSNSIDTEYGGYYTCLDQDGSMLSDVKYMWLQGRAVWTWSRLHNTPGLAPDKKTNDLWFENAANGAAFLEKGKKADGSLLFAVSRSGETPLHFQRKPYAAVFYVLACLEYGEALKVRGGSASAVQVWFAEAVSYFEKLHGWIDNPCCGC